MRIIKQGRILPETKITCPSCDSELAYDDRDVNTHHEEWYHELYIVCPVCGNRIIIKHVSEGC